jgi:HlyD family secretion protein
MASVLDPNPTAPSLPLPVVIRDVGSPPAGPPSRGPWRLPRAAVLVGAAVAVLGTTWWLVGGDRAGLHASRAEPTEPAPSVVVALGRLAPRGDLRALAAPFGAGDARVADVLVAEGQWVPAGTPLVTFDNAPTLRAALEVAERQLASRQAAMTQAERSVSSSQAESAAALARAEVAARAAEVEVQRWAALMDQGFVSPAAADQRRAQRDEAVEEQRRARAVVARHVGDGVAQPDLQAARLAVAVARAERDRAAQDLSKSVLRAPDDGAVIALHARPGERPGAAGILDFGDTRAMTAELELYQADVARVRIGQQVRLRSPALPDGLVGQVVHIGQIVGRQQRVDSSPAANLDARIVKATVALDAASSARARTLVGLEVRSTIETSAR